MSPIVNTEQKMSKAMLDGLTLHETFCVASRIETVTAEQVKEFLVKRFSQKLADQFDPKYLFNSQEV
jgi:hypothetical protein